MHGIVVFALLLAAVVVPGRASLLAQNMERARRAADSAVASLDTPDARSVIALGTEIVGGPFGAGDVGVATEIFRLGIERYPGSAGAWEAYGRALARRGDLTGATAAFRTVMAVDPRRTDAPSALVMLRAYTGDSTGSILLSDSMLGRAREIDDREATREAWITRAAVFVLLGRWANAAAAIRERIVLGGSLDRDVERILDHSYWDDHLLRNVWLEAGNGAAADSIERVALASAEGSGAPARVLRAIRNDHAFFRAQLALYQGRPRIALERAATFRTDNPNGYASIAAPAYLALGRPRLATDTLLALGRDGYYRRYLLARAALAVGDSTRARKLLGEVVTWNQLGHRFWLHEYAIIARRAGILLRSMASP